MMHDFTKVKNIYIICGRTDMRKGIDGLAALVQDTFQLDPYSENDIFAEGTEVEEIHHHPSQLTYACCQSDLQEIGATVAREEAKLIPAKIVCVRHIEHAYECKQCTKDPKKNAFISLGKAPAAVIPRSIVSPELLARIMTDKYTRYLPLYRQVEEFKRLGLETNDKNLSNWVFRGSEDWLAPIYQAMKVILLLRSNLHVDETGAQVIHRSNGKPAQSNAYNWVFVRSFRKAL